MSEVRRSPKPGQKVADPALLLAANGHVYVNATALPLAHRAGRRALRVFALTPREEGELCRRIADLTVDLLIGLPQAKRSER